MKKVFAVFLAVCIMASLGISAFADAADYPWGAYGSKIENVVIGDGLVNVPAEPFVGMKNITGVTLPASVKNIESAAFADSAIAEVRTAGDPEVLEGVKAFENAEVVQISQDEFDAAVKEITDNATVVGENESYIISGTSLLVRLFEKLTVPAAPFGLYEIEGSVAAASDEPNLNHRVRYDENGNVVADLYLDEQGRLVRGTYYDRDADGNIVETDKVNNTYNSDGSVTQNVTWETQDGYHGTVTAQYNKNGKPTERTNTWTGPDGSSGTYSEKFDENGNLTEDSFSNTDKDGNTSETKREFKYNADATNRKVTVTDGDGNENTYWETKDENGVWVSDDSIHSPE